jgi:predicted transcriptional regulator
MNNAETISWIYLAIAISSEKEPVSFAGISQIADGINHAIPTQTQMQNSIAWLTNKKLILKTMNKYSLSELGKEIYATSRNINGLMDMWKNLEMKISKLM